MSTFTKFDFQTTWKNIEFEADTRTIQVLRVPYHQRVEQIWEWTGWSTSRCIETRLHELAVDKEAQKAIDELQQQINATPEKFPYSRYFYHFNHRPQLLPHLVQPATRLSLATFPPELTSLLESGNDDGSLHYDGFLTFDFKKAEIWCQAQSIATKQKALAQARAVLSQIIEHYNEFILETYIYILSSEESRALDALKSFNRLIQILASSLETQSQEISS